MTTDLTRSPNHTARLPRIPAQTPHWRIPHGPALPLLGTMATTPMLAIAVIVLAASGVADYLEAASI